MRLVLDFVRIACRYSALEPHISAEIMELHHSKHHQTYVTSYNKLLEQAHEAESTSDSQALPKLSKGLNFHGGGACASAHSFHTDCQRHTYDCASTDEAWYSEVDGRHAVLPEFCKSETRITLQLAVGAS